MGLNTFNNLDPKKQGKIFRIALREFAEKGYARASINQIVERLGIAKGSIFQYFGDKEGLFHFVFLKAVDLVKGHLKNVREETRDQVFFDRLETILVSGVNFVRRHPRIYTVYTKIQFESKLAFCVRHLTILRQESFQFLSGLIEAGIRKGELSPDLDVDRAAFLLDAVMDRFLQAYMIDHLDAGQGLLHADQETTRRWARQVVQLLCAGLEKGGEKPVKKTGLILIIGAVPREISRLAGNVEGAEKEKIGRYALLKGSIFDREVVLMHTGPGPVYTAATLGWALPCLKPSLLILTGSGGGFREAGLVPGDLAIATEEVDPHLGREPTSGPGPVLNLPFLPNRVQLDKALAVTVREALQGMRPHKYLDVHLGPFLTVSTVTSSSATAARYHRHYAPIVENMEGFAAASICRLYRTPMLEIRCVSNEVGNPDRTSWDLALASERPQEALLTLFEHEEVL